MVIVREKKRPNTWGWREQPPGPLWRDEAELLPLMSPVRFVLQGRVKSPRKNIQESWTQVLEISFLLQISVPLGFKLEDRPFSLNPKKVLYSWDLHYTNTLCLEWMTWGSENK